MAKFTSFDAPIGTAGPISVRRATAEDFGGTQGFDKLAAGIKSVGQIIEKNQIKKDNATINQANIDNQGFGADLFRTAKENTDANATDFTTNVLADYDKNMEAQLAAAPNDRVRTEMKADFSRTRNSLVEKSSIFESLIRSKNEVNVFVGNGDKAGNVVFETPTDDQYTQTLDARTREINNTSLPKHIKAELLREEVKDLRFKQLSGQLKGAVTPEQVDAILAKRPVDELSEPGFTQLGNAGKAKKRNFKTEDRLARVERNAAIRDAQASVRGLISRLSKGEVPDADSTRRTEQLVTQVGDPLTSEMLFNATTVGQSVNTWLKLPSEDMEVVVDGLERDVAEGGATVLESKSLAAARAVLSKTLTGERKEQTEIDTTVTEAFDRLDKRLADGVDLSENPDVMIVLTNLPNASPRLQQKVKEAFAQNETVQGLVDMSIAELTKTVSAAEDVAALSDLNTVMRDTAKKVLADMVKTIDENYVDQLQKSDPTIFPPLDNENPSSMKGREALMESGSVKYNKAKQFHTTAEIASIGERLPKLTSDKQLEFIAGYTQNMTTENAVIALTELGKASPQVAFVGAGIASDPTYLTTGTTILRGQQKLTEEGGKLIPIITIGTTKGDMEISIGTAVIGALDNENLPPHHKAAVQSAALALIAAGATADAVDAVNRALGGDGEFGGIQTFNDKKFAAPVGVNTDMIENAFNDNPTSITALSVDGSAPRTVNGVAVSAERIIDGGTLERVGPDMFVVRMVSDGKLLHGAPGTPYTLHITQDRLKALGVVQR